MRYFNLKLPDADNRVSRIEQIGKANAYVLDKGLPGFSPSQIQWSLAASAPEADADLSKVT
jgi:hypothetical protein